MADKFLNKYRIPSARLLNWDYASEGIYFITICTRNREHYFGEIVEEKMKFSPIGILADVFWHEIKNHFPNVELDEFVVMPNHVHGILVLNGGTGNGKMDGVTGKTGNITKKPDILTGISDVVETFHETSQRDGKNEIENDCQNENDKSHKQKFMASISPKPNSVSTIIRSYKSAVTKHCNRLGIEFGWQTRFHDHIIRDQRSFENIQNYIRNNPKKWGKDKFNSQNPE